MIRLFIVDDHAVLREGLRLLLAQEPDFAIVGEAANGQQLLDQLPTNPTDVVLLDLHMPVLGGLATAERLHAEYPDLRILMLSMVDEPLSIQHALAAGAHGYLLKNAEKEEVLIGLRTVLAGRRYLSTDIGVDTREFMQVQFSSFFLEYVPLDIINTLFAVYLNEGIKIMFRIGYAFFKTIKEQILCSSSPEDFNLIARETLELLSDDGKKRFVNQCFHLRIVRIKKQFSLLDTKKEGNHKSYICEPAVLGESRLLNNENLVKRIYRELPNINKSNDLKRIFASWIDGYSMQYMIGKAEEVQEESSSFLFVIEDEEGSIIGAYLMHELGKTSQQKKIGSPENFLFSVDEEGEPQFYHCGVGKHGLFEYDGSDMYLGLGKKGCALLIDSDLKEGHTAPSEVFNNDVLTITGKREFTIKNAELFVFV